ncbi:thymidine kinase [Deltaproteobacteria bacterium]|nr:thymidine kinase [Deltaproteobacteria bacterium]
MAKLYFYYSAMNAGKTTTLLQSAYNYYERGMDTLILKPSLDDRHNTDVVRSRIGLETNAVSFNACDDLLELTETRNQKSTLNCLLLDEAQFLTKSQVFELGEIVDKLKIPVLAYGLRTDFKGELFEGSLHLLAWSDELIEIKTVCHCGKKAIMVLRLDENGVPLNSGEQIQIGGNDNYVSVCRKHFKSAEST